MTRAGGTLGPHDGILRNGTNEAVVDQACTGDIQALLQRTDARTAIPGTKRLNMVPQHGGTQHARNPRVAHITAPEQLDDVATHSENGEAQYRSQDRRAEIDAGINAEGDTDRRGASSYGERIGETRRKRTVRAAAPAERYKAQRDRGTNGRVKPGEYHLSLLPRLKRRSGASACAMSHRSTLTTSAEATRAPMPACTSIRSGST
jgi:hypothetical protein